MKQGSLYTLFQFQHFVTFHEFIKSEFSLCIIPFYFLLPIRKESIVLGSNFRSRDLPVLRTPEFENHIFSVWSMCMCVCVSVRMCVSLCVSVIKKKKITAESLNLVLNICIIGRCHLKIYIKIGQTICVQGHAKEF